MSYRAAMGVAGAHAAFRTVMIGGVMAWTVSGCFTSASDFGNDAERYIRDSSRLRAALLADGEMFTTADCASPPRRDVGETFLCQATDSTGATWEFAVEITGTTDYEVTVSRAP